MFDFMRVCYLALIALFGYFLIMYLVWGVAIPMAVASFSLALGVLSNVIRFAVSWEIEDEM